MALVGRSIGWNSMRDEEHDRPTALTHMLEDYLRASHTGVPVSQWSLNPNESRSSYTQVGGPHTPRRGADSWDFLMKLGEPTFLWLPGLDSTRTRAVCTLLHGNEPSGVRALHRWICEGRQPQVNVLCFIGSIGAALTRPMFSHRCIPEGKDLNRCFRSPFEGPGRDHRPGHAPRTASGPT
ncbi:MAG: hypothetical protein R3B95_16890 [Nitrospirales bacterium]|nr:succinylglutamate desuccinylase/aspartoacylase family protein [Nitrospirales bacterium]